MFSRGKFSRGGRKHSPPRLSYETSQKKKKSTIHGKILTSAGSEQAKLDAIEVLFVQLYDNPVKVGMSVLPPLKAILLNGANNNEFLQSTLIEKVFIILGNGLLLLSV